MHRVAVDKSTRHAANGVCEIRFGKGRRARTAYLSPGHGQVAVLRQLIVGGRAVECGRVWQCNGLIGTGGECPGLVLGVYHGWNVVTALEQGRGGPETPDL